MFMHATNFIQYTCELTGHKKRFCHNDMMDKLFDMYEILSLTLLASVLYFSDVCFDVYYVCVLVNMVGYFSFLTVTVTLRIKSTCNKPSVYNVECEVD